MNVRAMVFPKSGRWATIFGRVEQILRGHNIIKSITMLCNSYVCGEYPGTFHLILSIPHNIVMDLNNVMVEGGGPKVSIEFFSQEGPNP